MLQVQLPGGPAKQNPPQLIAEAQDRHYREGGVDPSAGEAGKLVEAKNKGDGKGDRRVQTEKWRETDKHSHRETGGSMPRVAVQREDGLEILFPFFLVEQRSPLQKRF